MKVTDRKTEIVTIAAQLFKEKGYSAVTMRDIAQAMDIKAASLYNHIKSKQEILVLIIIKIAEEFTNAMSVIVNSDETAVRKLEKIIQLHVDITIRDAAALASLNADWMHLADAELVYFLKMREDYEANFRIIIHKGIAAGEIKNYNAEVIIFSMLSTLRTLYLWFGGGKKLDAETLQLNLTKVLLHGII